MSSQQFDGEPVPETGQGSRELGTPEQPSVSRRTLLAGGVAVGLGSRLFAGGSAPQKTLIEFSATATGPESPLVRRQNAFDVRVAAAKQQKAIPLVQHPNNGDDDAYSDRRGSFTKGLPHDAAGIVDRTEYGQLLTALGSGEHADFEAIDMGSFSRFVSPQSAYAYHLEGPDSHALHVPQAPSFSSARAAAEMVEVYWQALCRDVPFSEYDTDPTVAAACADLAALSDYAGPSFGGSVAPALVFRHSGFIDVVGPYLSQFLWLTIPAGAMDKEQRYKVPVAGDDYGTTFADWLAIQRGVPQAQDRTYQPSPRYLSTARDLAEYVHRDYLYQPFLDAALYLCDLGASTFSDANPYDTSSTQQGFVTFGKAFVWDMLGRVTTAALKAAWYQKWLVHRRVRPEKYGAYLHRHMTGAATFDHHPDVLNSQAVAETFSRQGTYLCPMSYPEAAPLHPAYPSGHSTASGALATVMKALFNENFVLPAPVVANQDGTQLLPYFGPDLTVRGELDKLAFNVGMGRDWSGIHWRSDIEEGMRLGEAVALGVLKDLAGTVHESAQFTLTRFDGGTEIITP